MTRKESALAHVIASSDYHPRFAGWLFAHWDIYEEFERMSLSSIRRGRMRLSAKLIFELIRWNSEVREEGGPYKINNVFSASCARLFEHLNPQHAGHFETRKRRVAA